MTRLVGPGFGILAATLICLVVAGSLLGNSFVAGSMAVAAANQDWLPRFLAILGCVGFKRNIDPAITADIVESPDTALPSCSAKSPTFDAPINGLILSITISAFYIILGNFRALLTFNGLAEYAFFFLTVLGAIFLRFREPGLSRPYKPVLAVPVAFSIISGFFVTRGAVFAPVSAGLLVVLWGFGVVFYYTKREQQTRGDA